MGTVTFRSRSDIKEVERDNNKLQRQNAKLIEQLAKMGQVSKEAGIASGKQMRLASSVAKSAVGSVTSLIGSYVSLTTVIGGVNTALEEQKALAREALNESRGVAGSQQEAIKNFAGLAREDRKALLDRIPEIAKDVKFSSQAALIDAFAGAISASGDVKRSESAVRAAAKLTRLTPDATRGLAGGAIDIGRASGITDAEKNIGFLLSSGAQARVEDPSLLAKNLAPAVSQLVTLTKGQNQVEASREAGAFFAELSKDLTDTTGEITKTVTRQAGLQVRKFFTEGFKVTEEQEKIVKGKLKTTKVTTTSKPEFDPGTLFGRLKILADNEELRKDFLSKAALETAKVPLEAILTNPERLKQLEATKGQISFDETLFKSLRDDLEKLTTPLKLATSGEASKAATSQFLLQSGLAQRAQVREVTEAGLKNTRGATEIFSGTHENLKLLGLEQKSTADAIDQGIAILRERSETIQFGPERPLAGRPYPGRGMDKLPELQQEQIRYLQEQTQILKDLKMELQGQRGSKAAAARVQPGRNRD